MTMRVYGGSEDNCDGGGDAEGQKIKKEIVPSNSQTNTNTKSKKKLFQLASNSRSGNSSNTRKSSTETFLSWIPRRSRLATSKYKNKRLAGSEPWTMLTNMGL